MSKPRRIKRWLESATNLRKALYRFALGIILLIAGIALSSNFLLLPFLTWVDYWVTKLFALFLSAESIPTAKHFGGGALLMLGGYIVFVGAKQTFHDLMILLDPNYKGKFLGTFMRRQALSAGPSIVAIGGGTGLSTLLRGLRTKTSRITAIVTVTDDGGSSGRLVSDKKILPPGDIRNCLVALADAEKQISDLFQHRFEGESGSLSGHSTGNLLIAAMVDITGDFDSAIQEISRVLAIRGRVLPATLSHVKLRAQMEDGSEICGETKIVNSRLRVRRIFLEPSNAEPFPEVFKAIADADIIVIGPGSVYTSVIPPLLVPGIADALSKSDAMKVYVCNVMTQPGESDQFTASDHVHAIEANVGKRVFDYVMTNKARPSEYLLNRYSEFGQEFVEPDTDRIRAMGLKSIAANLISESDVVRHDPIRIADSIMRAAEQ